MSTGIVQYSLRVWWRILLLLVFALWLPAVPVQASRPPPLASALASQQGKAGALPVLSILRSGDPIA